MRAVRSHRNCTKIAQSRETSV